MGEPRWWRAITVSALTVGVVAGLGAAPAGATIAWQTAWPVGALRAAVDDGSAARTVAPAVRTFLLAPDGDAAVYDDRGRVARLASTGAGAGRPLRLPARASAWAAAWSPDGRALALARAPAGRSRGDVLVVDRRGAVRSRVRLAAGWTPTGVAFSPGGRRLALTLTNPKAAGRVMTVRRDGRGPRRSVDAGWDVVLAPLWTSRGVVYKSGSWGDEWSSQVGPLFGLELAAPPWVYRLTDVDGDPRSPSDDGRRFAVASSSCVWDLPARACVGGFGDGETVWDLSRDGRTALVAAGGRLLRAPVDGGPRAVVAGVGPAVDVQWGDGGR
jgi:hypothetical protein